MAMAGKSTAHPTSIGARMRLARSDQKPRTPFRCSIIRAKNPAMKKNSDIRKMCDVKIRTLMAVLGDVSTIAQMPGIMPGRNEKPA